MRLLALLLFLAVFAAAQEPILPPVHPFAGKSRALAVAPDHEWATLFERSGLRETPRYSETVSWMRRLCAAAPELEMVTIGTSAEGREIVMVIAGEPRRKPTLLAQAGIHAGEIDGKDAGMMLLRDIAFGNKKHLLDKAALLFIPILSVDGHERFGPHGRVNQRGPVEMGWRTNAQNLNLNRDYAKLDTAGVRAAVRVLNEWRPDLYLDIHVTDGADYQYDITWGYNGPHAFSPTTARWLLETFDPAVSGALKGLGHVPGPLVFLGKDGNRDLTFGARYSHGYGDLRHQPTILVENHSLKPYDQRVFGTYVLLEAALEVLGKNGGVLRDAIARDRASRRGDVPLSWKVAEGEPELVEFLGIERRTEPSPVSGGERTVWTGKPVTLKIPLHRHHEPGMAVARPKAYWIPVAWHDVIRRLRWHGIEMERVDVAREVEVEVYRVESFELATNPFEGRVRVSGKFVVEKRKERYPAGSVRVSTDQALGDLAVILLEPQSGDSFFSWGFFHHILQRTEYVEEYVIEPMAKKMLADPKLKAAYEKRLAGDAEFAKDPAARRRWFYERTPYIDKRWRLYPVGRE